MAAISAHPYGVFEEETYAGDRQIFYCQQEPSIYHLPMQQCPPPQPQQYSPYPAYPIIHDQSNWLDMEMEVDMDGAMSNCWMGAPEPTKPLPMSMDPQLYTFNPTYTPEYFEPAQFEYPPLSPITPAASPYQQDQYLTIPNSFHFNTFTQLQQPQYQFPLPQEESPHPSPYSSVPSLTASPLAPAPIPSSCASPADGEQDQEEEEEEDDSSIIPNCGNKELRGMGLYDDRPDLTFAPCTAPSSPLDRNRPLLGRGLVLEQSFGLPEKMMIKDEETGDILEGRLCVDEEEDEDEEEEEEEEEY